MRITCDACQAKYSIADDKISGKVFKIRCKKCSHVILVRGSAPAVEPAPAPPVADDAIWYVVIDQDQVGPLTIADVEHRWAAGEIDRDTFAWREGLADWEPLGQVSELVALLASTKASGATRDAAGATFAATAGDDARFAAAARDDARFAAAGDASADLFASAGARRTSDDVVTARAGRDAYGDGAVAAAAAGARLRGERNESSVLFSLNNLAQIANHTPAPASTTATGTPGTEGSGLIDIRSMASAYLGTGSASAGSGKPAATIGSIDDLPVFGAGGFSEPAVLVPTARPASTSKLLYVMIGAVALFAAVAAVLLVLLMKSEHAPAQPAQVAQRAGSATSSVAPTPSNAESEHAAPAPSPATEAAPAPSATGEHAATEHDHAASHAATEHDHAASRAATEHDHAVPPTSHTPATPARHATTAATAPHATTMPATPSTTDDTCDKVTCAFNGNEGACCAKFRAKTAATTTTTTTTNSDLPESLDVAKIQDGIAPVKGRAQACSDRSPAKGKVKVHFKVGGDGHVTNVSVESSPDAALGACVQAAAQKASFAKTQRGGSFNYTFVF